MLVLLKYLAFNITSYKSVFTFSKSGALIDLTQLQNISAITKNEFTDENESQVFVILSVNSETLIKNCLN